MVLVVESESSCKIVGREKKPKLFLLDFVVDARSGDMALFKFFPANVPSSNSSFLTFPVPILFPSFFQPCGGGVPLVVPYMTI